MDSKYKHTDEKPVFGIEYYHIWQDKQSDMSVITTLYSDVDEKEIEHYNWVREIALEKLKEDTFFPI